MSGTLKFGLFFSLLWHSACTLVFDVAFNNESFMSRQPVVFVGSILTEYSSVFNTEPPPRLKNSLVKKKTPQVLPLSDSYPAYVINKPAISRIAPKGKITNSSALIDMDTFLKEREQYKRPLFLNPRIPHHFLLYFKDRTSVHIELEFLLSQEGELIEVKRKVSSGNLDADLLVWRHINHWLFLHRKQLPRNLWQTVKIDLTRGGEE